MFRRVVPDGGGPIGELNGRHVTRNSRPWPLPQWLLSSPSDTTDYLCQAHVVDLREWLLAARPGFEGPNKRTMWLRQKFSYARAMRRFRRFHLLCILMKRQRNTLLKPSCRLLRYGWSKQTVLFSEC